MLVPRTGCCKATVLHLFGMSKEAMCDPTKEASQVALLRAFLVKGTSEGAREAVELLFVTKSQ